MAGLGNEPRFSPLSVEDARRLEKQRVLVAEVVREEYGAVKLNKKKSDLPILQRRIDDHVFKKTQTYELQCLGVAFGDVLSDEFPLRWVMVTDEYGTDPTLRYKTTSVQINAITMISKRVERDEPVSLLYLLETTGEELARWDKQFGK